MVRALRPVSDPLGSYLRVGRHDHTFLAQMLVDGKSVSGLVADPAQAEQHQDLWAEAHRQGVETVMDSRSLELSTPGGILRGGAVDLAWAPVGLHTTDSLYGRAGEDLYDPQWRDAIVKSLSRLPIDAVWLRVHPFGTAKSGPLALKRYLGACRDLHRLGRPLVGEHTGAVGVGLMAFGALGGVESGITVIDHTDLSDWLRIPKNRGGGGGEARVYLHQLGAFLDRSKADALLSRPGMKAAHACLDSSCCPRGWKDTHMRYREHFVTQREREVRTLSSIPEPLRAGHYLESFLRPASDKAVRASEVEPALMPVRKRLDSWRGTLGNDLVSNPTHSFSPPAAGKRHRKSA